MTYQSREVELYAYLERSSGNYLPSHLAHWCDRENDRHAQLDINNLRTRIHPQGFTKIQTAIEEDVLGKSDRQSLRIAIADYIADQSGNHYWQYEKWESRLRLARTKGAVGITDDGHHITAWDDKVNCVRLCPDEAREECRRVTRRYAPEILRLLQALPKARLYYAVFTEPNVPAGELHSGKRDQFKKFSNFHRSAWAKQRIKGSFVIQEDPLSANLDWNVHLNAIMLVEGDFPYSQLRKRWGNNVEIRQLKGTVEHIAEAFLECVKYAAKHIGEKSEDGKHTIAPGMTSWPWERFDEWFQAGKGFRRSRAYGALYKPEAEPEKGVDLDTVSWIGAIQWDVNGYRVHLKKEVEDLLRVDLIQADKFASEDYKSANLPDDWHSARPPDNQTPQLTNLG